MMNRKTILFVLLVAVLGLALQGTDIPTTFAQSHYYILSLGEVSADLASVVQSAQSEGFALAQFEVANVDEAALAAALDASSALIVDGSRFYLRETLETYTYTVRPSSDGYELVINPSQDVTVNDVLAAVLMDLQAFGILGSEVNLAFSSFAKADLKGPAPPVGVLIESTLYGLVVSEDWFGFAAANGLTQVGLRIEIVAEKIPGGVLASDFSSFVVEESESLVKLLLPIDELLALAESASIGYVRIAYQPAVP